MVPSTRPVITVSATAGVVLAARPFVSEIEQAFLEENRQRRGEQYEAQRLFDDGVHRLGRGLQSAQEPQCQGYRRHTAEGQPTGDRPVDVLVLAMNQHTTGFGNGRVQQIRAHRRGRVNAEPQQDWRHQRTAPNTGHADNKADHQTRYDQPEITEIH
jgi:hypothetical protein